MKYNNYYNHVYWTQFDVTLDSIKQESENFNFEIVRFENPEEVYSWLNEQVTWWAAKVQNLSNAPNIKKIVQKLEAVLDNVYLDGDNLIEDSIGIRFYRQLAGSGLIEHEDYAETSVALNFTFDDGVAPLTFRDVGDIYYKCCLFNVANFHSVKPSSIDRLMMRITPINVNYQEICKKLDAAGLLTNT
jgi:hypothetical protein